MMQTHKTKPMSLRQFTISLGFSPSIGRSWLSIPGFEDCLKVVRKGKKTYYYVTDPERAKEILKKDGYVLPEEGEDA